MAQAATAPAPARVTRLRVAVESSSPWMTFDMTAPLVRGRVVSGAEGAEVAWRPNGFSVAPKAPLPGRPAAPPHTVATVDLVYRLRAQPVEGAEVCAGNSGQVSVRVDRHTTAPARLLDLVGPAPGMACQRTPIGRAELAGPVLWPRPIDEARRVLAFYYPWYTADSFESGSWVDRPLAPWDTEDPAAVAAAVALAGDAGINGFIASYSHQEPNDGRRLDRLFQAADARPGFSVCALLEVEHMRGSGLGGAITAEDLERWVAAVLSRAGHRSQLHVAGRPVVMIYGMGRVTPEVWSTARSRLRADGLDPFVVADTPSGAHPIDGVYAYNPNPIASDGLASWYGELEAAARLDPAVSQRLWAAPVSPGEDDRAAPRPESQKRVVARRDGARYAETWQGALGTAPEWVLITSWNEWYEATAIAPSRQAGDLYLRLTRDHVARFASGRP